VIPKAGCDQQQNENAFAPTVEEKTKDEQDRVFLRQDEIDGEEERQEIKQELDGREDHNDVNSNDIFDLSLRQLLAPRRSLKFLDYSKIHLPARLNQSPTASAAFI
jgi:hypothetical protein